MHTNNRCTVSLYDLLDYSAFTVDIAHMQVLTFITSHSAHKRSNARGLDRLNRLCGPLRSNRAIEREEKGGIACHLPSRLSFSFHCLLLYLTTENKFPMGPGGAEVLRGNVLAACSLL